MANNFFAKKMPCILHGAAKKIRNTISRQVSGLAQLPDDLKFRVDQESNTYKSGGETWSILSLSTEHSPFDVGDEVLPNVVRVQNAKLDNPAGLEEENGERAKSKKDDAQLYSNYVPGLGEAEEGNRRDHEEESDKMVCEGEVP